MIQIYQYAWARWLMIAPALCLWFLFLHISPDSATTGVYSFVVALYLFRVASKAYASWLLNDRSHLRFWTWFALLLFASDIVIIMNYATGIGCTVIGAFICDRNADEGGIDPVHIRGGKVSSLHQAKQQYHKNRPANDDGILFGGVQVPSSEATTHFAFCGTTKSGKTVSIRLLMQDTISGIGHNRIRAVVYDPKLEFYPILEGMGIHANDIVVMNAFDARCRPWWIAKDIVTATDAETLANILVPEKQGNDGDFWRDATIIAIKAVVRYLNRSAPKRWTFRDLLLSLRSRDIMVKMMNEYAQLQHYQQVYGTDKTAANIMATVLTSIERYEPIAALWHKAETVYHRQPYSLTEWSFDSKLILLGSSETAAVQMGELNRIIITRLAQLLLEKPETASPESFVILDELADLGNMKPLIRLAEKGRSKGVCLVIGFQSKSHLEDNFNERLATAFLGQFNHIAALRLREAETAQWISHIMGKRYGIRYTEGVTSSWGSLNQYSQQEQYYEESVVDPGELTSIPPFRPDRGQGLKGLYIGQVNWWSTYPPSIIKHLSPLSASPRLKEFPPHYQELEEWTTADYQRLGMRHFAQDVDNIDLNDYLNG